MDIMSFDLLSSLLKKYIQDQLIVENMFSVKILINWDAVWSLEYSIIKLEGALLTGKIGNISISYQTAIIEQ